MRQYHTSNVQTLRKNYAVNLLILVDSLESERKKLTALSESDAALTAHILSETTRDESTSYADNGI